MASRPDTKHAVVFVPFQGERTLIICDTLGSANALVTALTENTDAAARVEGPVYELPMIITAMTTEVSSDIISLFQRDFSRVFGNNGRRLLELRNLTSVKGDTPSDDHWTATALWTFAEAEKRDTPAPNAVLEG